MRIHTSHARHWLAAAYLLVVLVATWQRGIASREHTTFAIFRQSFVHLRHHTDLYAIYPAEHGAAEQDRFKYSPSAAMLFAPLARVSYGAGLLVWNLVNAGLLFFAVTRLLRGRQADVALLLLLPEVFTSVQASSSNALIAALMLFAANWIGRGRMGRAAVAIAIGAAIKIFPIAVACMVTTQRHRRRFLAALALAGVALFLLPLTVVSPTELASQYASWRGIELRDALDVQFGMSFIRALRAVWLESWPNWSLQMLGIVAVLLPLSRRDRWTDTDFQLRFTCSLMLFVVLFNHQAERQSMVIAAAGCALWLASRPASAPRLACYAVALTGISVVPYAALWIVLQTELLGDGIGATARHVKHIMTRRPALAGTVRCHGCGVRASLFQLACRRCTVLAPAWTLGVLPQVVIRTTAFMMLMDEVTPGHMFFRWNLWDLVR
jgi:hypothetical protein